MSGKIVVAVIGVLLFIATEIYFPINDNDAVAKKQKHFWAVIFLIFSMVLGLPIELSFEAEGKLDQIQGKVDKHLQDVHELARFEQLHMSYDQNFGQAQPILKGWADRTFDYLENNWSLGLMPLVKEEAPEEIGRAYSEADQSIIATNVGGTKYYFSNGNYKSYNTRAADRGIPVVRFYLYSNNPNYHLEMRDGGRAQNVNEFFSEVKDLHRDLHSFCSIVIDVDAAHLTKVRDVLIMDNKFAAETVLSETDWDPIRALATENRDRINEIRSYVHTLLSARKTEYTLQMSPSDIKKYYEKRYPEQTRAPNPGDKLFSYLMDQLESPN
jgi:hypothetical protein